MSGQNQPESTEIKLAEAIRNACVEAAKEGFRDASIQGLCGEGAAEAAVGAIQMLDLEKALKESKKTEK
jgi:hypothetical protein